MRELDGLAALESSFFQAGPRRLATPAAGRISASKYIPLSPERIFHDPSLVRILAGHGCVFRPSSFALRRAEERGH